MKAIFRTCFVISFAILFVLPASGQTSPFKVKVVSSAPFPPCKRQLKPNGSVDVHIPTSVTIELDENTPNPRTASGDFVWAFDAGSVNCKTTGTGYEITFTGSGQPASSGGNTQSGVATSPTPAPIAAAGPPATGGKDEADAKALDLSVPESPGFTMLGLTPQEVTRPATPRQLATALINGFDRNGNFQSGIAIDVAPFQILYPKTKNKDYRENSFKGFFTRLAWRTQFSLATAKGTTAEDKSARVGTGLNIAFFDLGDPSTDSKLRMCQHDLDDVIKEEAYRLLGYKDGPQTDDEAAKAAALELKLVKENQLKSFEQCVVEAEKRNFGKSSFSVGLGASWISKTGDTAKLTNNGQGLWASLAYGFEGTSFRCSQAQIEAKERCITPQLIFHIRRRVKETVPDPLATGTFTTKDSNLFGTRLRLGVPTWAVNFEGIYRAERYAGRTSSSSIEASFGADYRLSKDLYLNFSIGGATKESNIQNTGKVFIRTSFNWGTSQKPLN